MLLEAWNAPVEIDRAEIIAKTKKIVAGRMNKLTDKNNQIHFEWTVNLPMPLDPDWNEAFVLREKIQERLNRCPLIVHGLRAGSYAIFEDDRKLGEATSADFDKGVNFALFPEFSPNRQAAKVRLFDCEARALAFACLVDSRRSQTARHAQRLAVRPGENARRRTHSRDQTLDEAENRSVTNRADRDQVTIDSRASLRAAGFDHLASFAFAVSIQPASRSRKRVVQGPAHSNAPRSATDRNDAADGVGEKNLVRLVNFAQTRRVRARPGPPSPRAPRRSRA